MIVALGSIVSDTVIADDITNHKIPLSVKSRMVHLLVVTDYILLNLGTTHSSLTMLFTIGVSILGGWYIDMFFPQAIILFQGQ